MSCGRAFEPDFVKREREKQTECRQWGVEYEPPLDSESYKDTKNRRARLTRAIKKRKNPAAYKADRVADRDRKRLDDQKRRSDPVAHEAFKEHDAKRARSQYQESPDKRNRPRDDVDGQSDESP